MANILNNPKTQVYDIVAEKWYQKCSLTIKSRAALKRAQENLDMYKRDLQFSGSVITGDESWVFEYNPKTKRQSSEWNATASPRPKKARMSKS